MQKDSVRAFKNELRNYNFYLSQLISLDNSIEFAYERLGGVRGIDPSKEPIHGMPNKDMEYKLRDDIERYERKKASVEAKVKEIDRTLNFMEEEIRVAIVSVYVNGKQVKYMSDRMYLSPSGLVVRMNKAIERALNE